MLLVRDPQLSGLMGADVKVTLEIEANIPDGAPEQVVRTVTENSRTLSFGCRFARVPPVLKKAVRCSALAETKTLPTV